MQSLKQSFLNKHIRLCYKVWSHNLPNGYLLDFNLYEGKQGHKSNLVKEYGLVLELRLSSSKIPKLTVKCVLYSVHCTPHILAIDNYFNSSKLCCQLWKKGSGVVGTVRADSIERALANSKSKKSPKTKTISLRKPKNRGDMISVVDRNWKWWGCSVATQWSCDNL